MPLDVTVATDVLLLDHVPPEDVSLRVTVAPAQTAVEPAIVVGVVFTVTVVNALQPVARV